MKDLFIKKLNEKIINEKLNMADVAAKLNVDVKTLESYLNGMCVPGFEFILKARRIYDINDENDFLSNIFTQGYFGTKIPLLTKEDFANDCTNRVIAYYEIPHLNKYGENNLFALKYTGNNIEDKGIMHDSILIFHQCTSIEQSGIYAVVKRGALSIKEATVTDRGLRIVNLEARKRLPVTQKTSVASGRLVCCINNY